MMKGRVIDNMRLALRDCGYSLDEVMRNRTQRREYTDIRAIVWSIYQKELSRTTGQVAKAFGWNRSTVYCAIVRANDMAGFDKKFSALYNTVYGHYCERKNV